MYICLIINNICEVLYASNIFMEEDLETVAECAEQNEKDNPVEGLEVIIALVSDF